MNFVDGFHISDATNIPSVPKLVKENGWHFTMSPEVSYLRSRDGRTFLLGDCEVPTFDLKHSSEFSQYLIRQETFSPLLCAEHSDYTHLDEGKNCDICQIVKIKERPKFAVDQTKEEERRTKIEEHLKNSRYLESLPIDSIGRSTKSFSGSNNATLCFDKSRENCLLDSRKTMMISRL